MIDDTATLCPCCTGEGEAIGVLVRSLYYRCNHCGTTFSETVGADNVLRPGLFTAPESEDQE